MDQCRKGHLYTAENTYRRTDGKRECHICRKAYQKTYKGNNREKLQLQNKQWAEDNAAKLRSVRKKWRKMNLEEARERERNYYRLNKDDCRKRMWTYHIKRPYGLSPENYLSLVEQQEYKCKICQNEVDYRLLVDHDHTTGAIRGLLCKNCNWGLARFADSVEKLQAAIAYLRSSHTGFQVEGRAKEELMS